VVAKLALESKKAEDTAMMQLILTVIGLVLFNVVFIGILRLMGSGGEAATKVMSHNPNWGGPRQEYTTKEWFKGSAALIIAGVAGLAVFAGWCTLTKS